MLLKCPKCNTHYEVEDTLIADPTVQVQCESCEVVLVPAVQEGKIKDEKTAMLAAFDPEEIEKIMGQTRMAGSSGKPAAARRPPAAAPAQPPPTVKIEPYIPPSAPPRQAAPEPPPEEPAPQRAAWPPPSRRAQGGGARDGGGARRGAARQDDDPLSAIAGDSARAEEDDLGCTRLPDLVPPREMPDRLPRRGAAQPPAAAAPPDEAGEEGEESEEQRPEAPPPVRVTPRALLVIAPLALIGLLVGSVLLLMSLLGNGDADKTQGQAKALSYGASLTVLLRRTQGSYATTKLTGEVDQALPVFVHDDGILIRTAQIVPLEGGHVPRDQQKGLLIKDLAIRLAQELAPVQQPSKAARSKSADEDGDEAEQRDSGPPPPPPLGKGQKALLLAAQEGVRFDTIGRVLFTAQSVGYRTFFLAGTPVDAPDTLRGLKLDKDRLSWFRIGPGMGGKGLGLLAGGDGFVLFDRSGSSIRSGDEKEKDKEENDRIQIPRSSSALSELASAIKDVNGGQRYREIVVQPSAAVTYDQLIALLERLVGEDGDGPFRDITIAGADI